MYIGCRKYAMGISLGMSRCSLVVSARGSSQHSQIKVSSRPRSLKAEVTDRVACHAFVIFQAKRNEYRKN